jgi:uncharacterized protein
MLAINVAQQLKEPIGAEREYEIDGLVDIEGKQGPVSGHVKMVRTDRGIIVRANITGEMEITCSRCLAEFRWPLKLDFQEEYLQTIDMVSGGELPVPKDSGSFTIDARHTLDLSEAIRQYALLSVPIKPLCREKCVGLCPACGQNLNKGKCQCPARQVDPRWAPLLKLEDKLKGKE